MGWTSFGGARLARLVVPRPGPDVWQGGWWRSRARASGKVGGAAGGGPPGKVDGAAAGGRASQGGWCRGRGRTSGKVGWWRAGGGICPFDRAWRGESVTGIVSRLTFVPLAVPGAVNWTEWGESHCHPGVPMPARRTRGRPLSRKVATVSASGSDDRRAHPIGLESPRTRCHEPGKTA